MRNQFAQSTLFLYMSVRLWVGRTNLEGFGLTSKVLGRRSLVEQFEAWE